MNVRILARQTSHSVRLLLLTVFILGTSVCRTIAMSTTGAASASSSSSSSLKRILVTGGNKGIGRAVCERLLEEWKDTYVFLGSRDAARGKQAVEEVLQKLAGTANDRIEPIEIDTSSDESVQAAAEKLAKRNEKLYGIINNAGIGFGYSMKDCINTNYFGPRRVNDAFGPLLIRPGGRIVNVASASGPNFVASLSDSDPLRQKLAQPWTIPGGVAAVDEIAKTTIYDYSNSYGASKALLNAYTVIFGKSMNSRNSPSDGLVINSVTPGFIATDITAGMGATNPPSKGAVPICYLMMDTETIPQTTNGRYYGSDGVRSPLHVYRGPGDEPYTDDNQDDEGFSSPQSEL